MGKLSNISENAILTCFLENFFGNLSKGRERKLCHKSNTSKFFLERSITGEIFGRMATRPQEAEQFIKSDGTLVQSVDSNAINIYFNKILSFLFACVLRHCLTRDVNLVAT